MKAGLLFASMIAITFSTMALSQAVPAVKEAGHATAETAKEGGDKVKAATEKQPNKAVDQAKAQGHKAKAHAHGHAAKTDAKDAVK
jgi:hypothetical protein